MLTGLKFKLESIDLTNPNKASLRLQELKEITLGLIRGVRIVTFNLTPDVLSDYGLAAGLKKLSAEIGKLTGKNILFENKTDFNQRLNSMAETNLYRIAQEAINNAIKYANASFILVSISHSPEMLSVVVTDDGVGFDLEAHQKTDPLPNLGMGIAFMKERVNFINGKLFINASPGKGVRISVNMPIDNSLA